MIGLHGIHGVMWANSRRRFIVVERRHQQRWKNNGGKVRETQGFADQSMGVNSDELKMAGQRGSGPEMDDG